ncbi:hypothetical protein [Taklimakanibacter albus]|uniref:Uncharacterized protein n=1 Tax=Taklimakanibacter albus TaxID=2800327 RepID=A0ACC5R1P9_9HYPH|nr:hypothetical protein [Aestuariivirga sp. YIM B02566]MBK1866406.1 hypothetical protein [Aestuariivirga sp. YIM B02566]
MSYPLLREVDASAPWQSIQPHTLMSAADERLLALYPRWFAAMAAWDDDEGSMLPSFGTGKPARLRDMERIMLAAEGHGPIGAIIKLCIHRTRMRTDGCSAASEAITLLARSMGIEPYGKEVST